MWRRTFPARLLNKGHSTTVHPVELHTARLALREFREDDCARVLAYQRDPAYLQYYPWEDRSREDVAAFIGGFIIDQTAVPRLKYQLAIILLSEDKLIGNCGIRIVAAAGCHRLDSIHDPQSAEANIGFEIGPAYWGNGYATQAAREILRFGFDELGMGRITATCTEENEASAAVLARIGMVHTDTVWRGEFFKARWWAREHWAIDKASWRP